MEHDHGLDRHPDEMPIWDEFRIIYEEQPERAKQIVLASNTLHRTVRWLGDKVRPRLEAVADMHVELSARDNPGNAAEMNMTQVAICYGILRSIERNLGEIAADTSLAITAATGCSHDECDNSWTTFLDPPLFLGDDEDDEDEGASPIVLGLGMNIGPSIFSGPNGTPVDGIAFAQYMQDAARTYFEENGHLGSPGD